MPEYSECIAPSANHRRISSPAIRSVLATIKSFRAACPAPALAHSHIGQPRTPPNNSTLSESARPAAPLPKRAWRAALISKRIARGRLSMQPLLLRGSLLRCLGRGGLLFGLKLSAREPCILITVPLFSLRRVA